METIELFAQDGRLFAKSHEGRRNLHSYDVELMHRDTYKRHSLYVTAVNRAQAASFARKACPDCDVASVNFTG